MMDDGKIITPAIKLNHPNAVPTRPSGAKSATSAFSTPSVAA